MCATTRQPRKEKEKQRAKSKTINKIEKSKIFEGLTN